MGCAGSKESDKTAAGARDVKEKYGEMAEDAASMLSGSGEERTSGRRSLGGFKKLNLFVPLLASSGTQSRTKAIK